MSLPQEDSIIPIALEPVSFERVLPTRERTLPRRATRETSPAAASAPQASVSTLAIGALATLLLLALPLPLLLDETVSIAPRAGLLALFVLPPALFMYVVQSRYGRPSK
ncbi:MAG: hypothetical protein CL927_08030 [Deltaproteobacteria bacterium]|nr:hypothetical protein [Deltaproteobacteria bacterium]